MATGEARGNVSGVESEILIRVLETPTEMEACVNLQRQAWGFSDLDLIPRRVFIVARKIGGQILGAWDGEHLVGFSLALPGHRPGHTFWHSHMLAVASSHRNRGIGRRLKLRQRESALAVGIDLIEWTFDPLEIKNAYFNLSVLGAIARHYHPDLYGTTSSKFQAGLTSDRLTAEWPLRSARAEAAAKGETMPAAEVNGEIAVPGEIGEWRQQHDPRASETQARVRTALTTAFANGQAVVGYRMEAGEGRFLLGPVRPAEVGA